MRATPAASGRYPVRISGNKKPRLCRQVRGSWESFSVFLLGRVPLTRTSAGNKEYEYKKKERALDQRHTANARVDARKAVRAVAAAMRHETDPKRVVKGMSRGSCGFVGWRR